MVKIVIESDFLGGYNLVLSLFRDNLFVLSLLKTLFSSKLAVWKNAFVSKEKFCIIHKNYFLEFFRDIM